MSKPEDIPQDVWRVAQNICDQACMPEHYYTNGVVSAVQADIARAILAAKAEEREALIVLVEQHPFWAHRSPRADLIAAIRKRGEVNTAHKNSEVQ